MPHQCLKCGKIFKEGSSQLLKGCPECGGNRFFYTKKPLDKKERENKKKEVGEDINSALKKIVEKQQSGDIDKNGDWVNIKPKHVSNAFKKHLTEKKKDKKSKTKNIDKIIDEDYRNRAINEIKSSSKKRRTEPETIDINQTGDYSIDLKGLMEEEPIIIQKKGSYTIHLPSVFKSVKSKRKK
ncbi:MAG: Zn-ribbon containing protein [Candidatus Thermoplasmatota archaeon]